MRDNFKYRSLYIKIFTVVAALVLIGQLANLQIIKDYGAQADDNAFLRKTVYAMRGLIYDRNDKLLVFNQPIYDLDIIVKKWDDLEKQGTPIDTTELCAVLDIEKESFVEKLNTLKDRSKNPNYSSLIPQKFITQLTPEDAAVLQEVIWKFPGISLVSRTMRQYTTPYAAHAIGSIGEVSKAVLKKRGDEYKQGDYIGVSGVEKQYEDILKGKNGLEIFLRDVNGRIQGRYKDGKEDIAPVGGKALTLSIDIDLQAYGEMLMQNKVGSIVAIEPATGEILALVSSPSYDLSGLIGKQRGENYAKLLKDPYKPLLDRPMMAYYPPGSTFKTANALIFEHQKIIDADTRFSCHMGYVVGSFRVGCHAHSSPLDLANSISNSCNAYYCAALRKMLDDPKYGNIKNAFNEWKRDIVSLGFGYKLGVDFPNENRGFIPNTDTYDRIHGKDRWRSLNVVSISIGQGEILSTPIQLANFCAIIANRGYWIRPHVLKKIEGMPLDTAYTNRRYSTIEPQYFEPIIKGMEWAVNGGGSGSTARIAKLDSIIICGKTGTAENPHGENHSIFIAFAPKDNPKIAMAIVVENSGYGATWATPIVSLMIEKYLTGKISEKRQWLEDRMRKANLMPYIRENAKIEQ